MDERIQACLKCINPRVNLNEFEILSRYLVEAAVQH